MRNPSLGTLSANPNLTGRRRYGGGATFSPTMGQVDPAGYRDREMRNKSKVNAYKAWMKDRLQGKEASANVLRFGGK